MSFPLLCSLEGWLLPLHAIWSHLPVYLILGNWPAWPRALAWCSQRCCRCISRGHSGETLLHMTVCVQVCLSQSTWPTFLLWHSRLDTFTCMAEVTAAFCECLWKLEPVFDWCIQEDLTITVLFKSTWNLENFFTNNMRWNQYDIFLNSSIWKK